MKINPAKVILAVAVSLFFAYFLSGCATVPKTAALPGGLPVFNLNGAAYVPLVSVCDMYGINWEYDTFTRSVVLTKDLHRFNLTVGQKMVLVDGKPDYLSHPVDMYQGTVAIPLKFQERLSGLFAQGPLPPPRPRPGITRIKKVVIDAGHGGNDPGAIGKTGLKEKNVNLDIAKRLEKLLTDAGVGVVMTRTSDNFISLERRVDVTNNSGADLFVSIHSNANRVRGLNGFEVYYVSGGLNDTRRGALAAKDCRPAYCIESMAGDNTDLRATLWDMIYTVSRAESVELSRAVCHTIDRDMDTKVLGIKGANFYVLKGARMPAVLIEVGFVSNPKEELLLKNTFYRQQIAEAICDGIQEYAKDYTIMEASR